MQRHPEAQSPAAGGSARGADAKGQQSGSTKTKSTSDRSIAKAHFPETSIAVYDGRRRIGAISELDLHRVRSLDSAGTVIGEYRSRRDAAAAVARADDMGGST